MDTGLHYGCLSEIQNGTYFQKGAIAIAKNATATITSNKLTLSGTDIPINNQVVVEDINGLQVTGIFSNSDRSVTTTGLADGVATVIYQCTEADVQILDISSTEFPKNMRLWLHSITYNRKTNKKVEDVYKIYYNVMADGADSDEGTAGKNSPDKIKFEALADDEHDGSMGKVVIIPTQSTTVATPPTLTADSTSNIINTAIDLTYTSTPAWQNAITEIYINSVQIPLSEIVLADAKITLAAGLFPTAGIYNIVICAKGYATATINQTITTS